jgi:superkiller protein 3
MKKLLMIAAMLMIVASCSGEKREGTIPAAAEKTDFETLTERITADPRDVEAWYRLADLYNRSGMYRKEVDALIKVIALKPDRGYAYMELAAAYNRMGQYHDAIENLQKAKKYFPRYPVLYNNLAVTYGKLGNEDEEIALLKKAISLRPRYGTARYNLGVVSLRRGERSEASRQYEELKKFDDAAADALKNEIDNISKDRKSWSCSRYTHFFTCSMWI